MDSKNAHCGKLAISTVQDHVQILSAPIQMNAILGFVLKSGYVPHATMTVTFAQKTTSVIKQFVF
jgi:hypothetical protein